MIDDRIKAKLLKLLQLRYYLVSADQPSHWINSSNCNRTQTVVYNWQRLTGSALDYGISQGSELGHMFLSLHSRQLPSGMDSVHIRYADDTRLYAHFKPTSCHDLSA